MQQVNLETVEVITTKPSCLTSQKELFGPQKKPNQFIVGFYPLKLLVFRKRCMQMLVKCIDLYLNEMILECPQHLQEVIGFYLG